MRRHCAFACVLFGVLPLMGIAQTAPDSIANPPRLPLRNLQIEVRQLQASDSQGDALGGSGGVQIGTNGQAAVQGQLQLQHRQTQQSASAMQQALVLNGRSVRIALGAQLPVRFFQTWVRDGRAVTTQGTLLLDAGTGFNATPRWDGSELVELEIATQQARVHAGGLADSAANASVVVVPLGEWTTVAQSEQSSQNLRAGLAGSAQASSQSRFEIQVRVTLR